MGDHRCRKGNNSGQNSKGEKKLWPQIHARLNSGFWGERRREAGGIEEQTEIRKKNTEEDERTVGGDTMSEEGQSKEKRWTKSAILEKGPFHTQRGSCQKGMGLKKELIRSTGSKKQKFQGRNRAKRLAAVKKGIRSRKDAIGQWKERRHLRKVQTS